MAGIDDVFGDLFASVDAVVLFSPSGSYYERFVAVEDLDVVVVGTENAVSAETFVELPSSSRTSPSGSDSDSRVRSNRA